MLDKIKAYNKGDYLKGVNTGLVRQTLGFFSLAVCNYANFDHVYIATKVLFTTQNVNI